MCQTSYLYFQTSYFKNCLIIVEADYSALHVLIPDNPEKSNCNADVEKKMKDQKAEFERPDKVRSVF